MSAVAWVDINVFAPQAVRAMVCVAVACNMRFALLACEIFDCTGEFFCHITSRKAYFWKKIKTLLFPLFV